MKVTMIRLTSLALLLLVANAAEEPKEKKAVEKISDLEAAETIHGSRGPYNAAGGSEGRSKGRVILLAIPLKIPVPVGGDNKGEETTNYDEGRGRYSSGGHSAVASFIGRGEGGGGFGKTNSGRASGSAYEKGGNGGRVRVGGYGKGDTSGGGNYRKEGGGNLRNYLKGGEGRSYRGGSGGYGRGEVVLIRGYGRGRGYGNSQPYTTSNSRQESHGDRSQRPGRGEYGRGAQIYVVKGNGENRGYRGGSEKSYSPVRGEYSRGKEHLGRGNDYRSDSESYGRNTGGKFTLVRLTSNEKDDVKQRVPEVSHNYGDAPRIIAHGYTHQYGKGDKNDLNGYSVYSEPYPDSKGYSAADYSRELASSGRVQENGYGDGVVIVNKEAADDGYGRGYGGTTTAVKEPAGNGYAVGGGYGKTILVIGGKSDGESSDSGRGRGGYVSAVVYRGREPEGNSYAGGYTTDAKGPALDEYSSGYSGGLAVGGNKIYTPSYGGLSGDAAKDVDSLDGYRFALAYGGKTPDGSSLAADAGYGAGYSVSKVESGEHEYGGTLAGDAGKSTVGGYADYSENKGTNNEYEIVPYGADGSRGRAGITGSSASASLGYEGSHLGGGKSHGLSLTGRYSAGKGGVDARAVFLKHLGALGGARESRITLITNRRSDSAESTPVQSARSNQQGSVRVASREQGGY